MFLSNEGEFISAPTTSMSDYENFFWLIREAISAWRTSMMLMFLKRKRNRWHDNSFTYHDKPVDCPMIRRLQRFLGSHHQTYRLFFYIGEEQVSNRTILVSLLLLFCHQGSLPWFALVLLSSIHGSFCEQWWLFPYLFQDHSLSIWDLKLMLRVVVHSNVVHRLGFIIESFGLPPQPIIWSLDLVGVAIC